MGRYSLKEGKKRRKVTKKGLYVLKLRVLICKFGQFAMQNTFPTQSRRRNEGAQSAKGERSLRYNSKAVDVACIRSVFSCVRVYAQVRTPSNSNLVFLLSQVSHLSKNEGGLGTRFEGDNPRSVEKKMK